jgi:glycosyltransferase involved in cell wall biosynthesis
MKNILIICDSFPPQKYVGGLRPAMFSKYLPKYGWEPYIITRWYGDNDNQVNMGIPGLPDDKKILRYMFTKKNEQEYIENRGIIKIIRDFIKPQYSSPPGLLESIQEQAIKFAQNIGIDAVLATIPSLWTLQLGIIIAKKCNVPVVADFRDISEQESGMPRKFRQRIQVLRSKLNRDLLVKKASLILTVSETHKKIFLSKFKIDTELIYNGYDEDYHKTNNENIGESGNIKIVYTGRILNQWYQDPQILIYAIDDLIEKNIINKYKINVEFYGTESKTLNEIIKGVKNKDFIKILPSVPYENVPNILNSADVLLLLTNKDRKGILTTKFFEYLGVNKPILCVPGDDGELDQIIRRTRSGVSIDNINDMEKYLKQLCYGNNNSYNPNTDEINKFTRSKQVKRLAERLIDLTI